MSAREQVAGAEDFYGLDPHWNWIEINEFGQRAPTYIKGQCRHLEKLPVESVDGELVALLCVTCDMHFYQGSAA